MWRMPVTSPLSSKTISARASTQTCGCAPAGAAARIGASSAHMAKRRRAKRIKANPPVITRPRTAAETRLWRRTPARQESAGERSATRRRAIRARIGGAGNTPRRGADDRACVSHAIGITLAEDKHVMSSPLQCGNHIGVDTVFYGDAGRPLAPGPPGAPARGADRLAGLHTEAGDAREYGRLKLRLRFAAHRAVDHRAPVVETRQRRVKGVERLAAWRERVDRFRIERKAGPTVLPEHASAPADEAGPEFPEERLDEGDGQTAGVDRTHPDRVAAVGGQQTDAGTFAIDGGGLRIEPRRLEKLRDRTAESRVGDMPIADGRGPLRRLDHLHGLI